MGWRREELPFYEAASNISPSGGILSRDLNLAGEGATRPSVWRTFQQERGGPGRLGLRAHWKMRTDPGAGSHRV